MPAPIHRVGLSLLFRKSSPYRSSPRGRAIFIATVNGVMKSLGITKETLRCRDDEPEKCAKEIAATLLEQYWRIKERLVGMNPAIAQCLVGTINPENVRITDLNFDNIDTVRFGVMVWNGRSQTEILIASSGVILINGKSLVNGTFDAMWRALQDPEKPYFIYRKTGAGICDLMGFDRLCPCGGLERQGENSHGNTESRFVHH